MISKIRVCGAGGEERSNTGDRNRSDSRPADLVNLVLHIVIAGLAVARNLCSSS